MKALAVKQKLVKSKGEVNVGKSMTIPDLNLSLREILVRYSRGQMTTVSNQGEGQFYEEFEIPDLQGMDLAEISEYKDNLEMHIQEMNEEINRRQEPVQPTEPKPEETVNEPVTEG